MKSKLPKKTFKVKCLTYKTEVLFVLGCSHPDLVRYLRRYKLLIATCHDPISGTVLTFRKPACRVVWVEDHRRLEVLIHEIFHLVTGILHDRGIPIIAYHPDNSNGDESAAYLLEFFVTECLRKLKR